LTTVIDIDEIVAKKSERDSQPSWVQVPDAFHSLMLKKREVMSREQGKQRRDSEIPISLFGSGFVET